jgi:hypothetical protein
VDRVTPGRPADVFAEADFRVALLRDDCGVYVGVS